MNTLPYFHESLPQKLFFFEFLKCYKFQNVGEIIFPLDTFLTRLQKLFRGELLQVVLVEIDCAIFYTKLHELFCQFIS